MVPVVPRKCAAKPSRHQAMCLLGCRSLASRRNLLSQPDQLTPSDAFGAVKARATAGGFRPEGTTGVGGGDR